MKITSVTAAFQKNTAGPPAERNALPGVLLLYERSVLLLCGAGKEVGEDGAGNIMPHREQTRETFTREDQHTFGRTIAYTVRIAELAITSRKRNLLIELVFGNRFEIDGRSLIERLARYVLALSAKIINPYT